MRPRFLAFALFLLVPVALLAQTSGLTQFNTGTVGASASSSSLVADTTDCVAHGTWSSGNFANYTYASTPTAPQLPAPTTICGTSFTGNSTKSMMWTTGFTPVTNLNYHFASSSIVRIGYWYCADFDPMLSSSFQYSWSGVGSANMTLNGSGISLEVQSGSANPGFLAYHGGNCTSDATNAAWRYIAMEFNGATAVHHLWVYDASITTLLVHFQRTSSLVATASQTSYGITGGETQEAGHHIYQRNILFSTANAPGVPLLPSLPPAHIWSGMIDQARATDWNLYAGVAGWGGNGTIPSASWTQSGATLNPGATGAQINSAIAACGTNQFVRLGAGNFTITDTGFNLKANCVIRGAGANQTKIIFSGSPIKVCNALICADSGSGNYPSPTSWYQWSAGYSQYGTSITLANGTGCTLGSTCPITPNSTLLVLDQCDDSLTGDTCTGAASIDNGQFFNCSLEYNGTNNCSDEGGNNGNGNPLRFLSQIETIASINTGTGAVVLNRPLTNPNWASARTPHAIPIASISNGGIEDLSIDTTALSFPSYSTVINIRRALNYWVRGVSVINYPQFAVFCFICKNVQIVDNYFYGGSAPISNGVHAVETALTSDMLVQNNIAHNYKNPYHAEGPDTGSVWSYNLCIGENFQSTNIAETLRSHSSGDTYQLWEGNHCPTFRADDTHGTTPFQILYRNFLNGWKICPTGTNNCGNSSPASFGAVPIYPNAYSRFNTFALNILGEPNFATTYKSNSLTANAILDVGWGNGAATPPVPNDSIAFTSALYWGNWDVVTNATRWCGNSSNTGWTTTCASTSEVPTSAPGFPNALPTVGDTAAGQAAAPASLYLSAKPAWFQSLTFPPIGPDVSSGNVGMCSGTLNTPGQLSGEPATQSSQCTPTTKTAAWAGHVNAIPAFNCYVAVMGGPVDGSGPALSFNANSCYNAAGSPLATPSPTSLTFGSQLVSTTSIGQTITLTNGGGASLSITSIVASGDFGQSNNCGASLGAGANCTITVTFTPTLGGSRNGAITITDNASDSPQTVPLAGTGVGTVSGIGTIQIQGNVVINP